MTSIKSDVTLLAFNSIDLRDTNVGDIVRFRSTSLAHNKDLPLRHGRTCKVVAFSRSRSGQQQVSVAFQSDPMLGDEGTGLTAPIPMAAANLVPNNEAVAKAALPVRKAIQDIIMQSIEAKRPWGARIKVQDMLSDAGMYDRLGAPAQPASQDDLDDLPY